MDSGEVGIVFLVLCIIGGALWIRKNVKNSEYKDRVVPFREPLVPEEFYKVCNPAPEAPYTVVWILRDYGPGAAEMYHTIHSWNRYMKETLGWNPVVIVPDTTLRSHHDIPIIQFYQRTEIGILMRAAKMIWCGPMVYETAAVTAKRSGRPLYAIGDREDDRGEFELARKVLEGIQIVYTSEWIRKSWGFPGIVFQPILKLKLVATSRNQITGILNSVEEARQFFKLGRALPEFYFLGISRNLKLRRQPERNIVVWPWAAGTLVWMEETGILCCYSGNWAAVEAAASGIPVLCAPDPVLKEILGPAGSYRPTSEWAATIRELKTNIVAYENASKYVIKATAEWNSKGDAERLKLLVEDASPRPPSSIAPLR
jgi:hypothetical protein